jgi:predicted Zn-dependent peptidase
VTRPTVPPNTSERVERTELESGVRVVTEAMPELRSVSVGFWVDAGSRDEADDEHGASHFLEHLLFKGTADRTALEIAESVESVGGDMNAYTTKEYTAYYVRLLDEHLDMGLDLLSDIVWRPAFRPDEVESERQVILEEIRMRDDTPDDLVHELFAEALFGDHPLGREVIGTEASILGMTRDGIAAFHGREYRTPRVVVAAAGNLDHADVVRRVSQLVDPLRVEGGARARTVVAPIDPSRRVVAVERATEQAHLVVGVPSLTRDDPDRHALTLLNHVLGGGMASRLFQEIRERRGLAYSVYSYRSGYHDGGSLAVYAGTAPSQAGEVLALVSAELERLVTDGTITERELANAKGAMKGGLALGLESPASRMSRLGRAELLTGEIPTVDQLVRWIDDVTLDDVARVVDRVLRDVPRTLAAVGPVDPEALLARVA